MPRVIAVIALFLGSAAWAQKAPESVDSPAMQQLEDADKAGLGPVADGSATQNDNGTETVRVERNILLKESNVPTRRVCTPDDAGAVDGSRRPMGRTCETEPAHTVRSFGDRHHLRITDREKYASSQGKKWAGWGALIGGLIGALGFLTLLIPGVGIAAGVGIGLAAMAVGAGTGAVIGHTVAKNDANKKPENYTEDDEKWSESR